MRFKEFIIEAPPMPTTGTVNNAIGTIGTGATPAPKVNSPVRRGAQKFSGEKGTVDDMTKWVDLQNTINNAKTDGKTVGVSADAQKFLNTKKAANPKAWKHAQDALALPKDHKINMNDPKDFIPDDKDI